MAFLFPSCFPGFGLIPKKLGWPQWRPNSDTLRLGLPHYREGLGIPKARGIAGELDSTGTCALEGWMPNAGMSH